MAPTQDLPYINNIVKMKADEYLRTKGNKTTNADFVQVLISSAVKELIERQDNANAELVCSKNEEINHLKKQVQDLKNENNDLRQQIDDVAQYNRRDNLKIIGVPYKKDEDVLKIVKDIAKHTTGEELDDNEISVAHRVMSKEDREKLDNTPYIAGAPVTPKNAPSIVVKFCKRNTKSKIFESRKQTAAKPNCPHPKAEIYEDVTPLRSRILYALRNKKDNADNKVFRYVWSREGRIFCRTEAESKQSPQPKPNIINRPQDLSKLGWTQLEIDEIIHKKNFFPNSTAPASH